MTLPVEHVWLIPVLPMLAAAIGALTPRQNRAVAAGATIITMAASFVLAVMALCGALAAQKAGQSVAYANFDWFDLGLGTLQLGWMLDPLAGFMLVMVTFVGLLIFIFSLGYMSQDENFSRFFCFLSLFASAMLGLLVANSLLLLFIFWEIVGLASYLLIGFWFHKPEAAAAAKKAFITTRIGDLGLLLGMIWLFDATGTMLFYDGGNGALESAALQGLTGATVCGGLLASTAIGLLIFCGAIGKSGQFPLHVWLPDAMEGPTPVSALIHAATMVAAGVFLIARVYPLMEADLTMAEVSVHALTVVAIIGSITALLGAVIAVGQNDIKRVLAFSTVSQLGYMMLALGVGSWVAAIFHLLTHAFFKALLFLGAGSVIHASHHEQDMRNFGGLAPRMRITFLTFAVGTMALAGVPFFFSGFWSKEAILHAAEHWEVSHIPLVVALVAVAFTAFYMTRLVMETFFGKGPREHHLAEHPPKENSAVMTTPLVILMVCAIGLGFLGTPAWPWLQRRLDGGELHLDFTHLFEGGMLMFLSIALVGIGIAVGWWVYGRKTRGTAGAPDPLEVAQPKIFNALSARLGFDEFYAATVFRLNAFLGNFADWADRWVWGGAIRSVTALSRFFAFANRQVDEELINDGFDHTSESLRGAGINYSRTQNGSAHGYLRAVAAAFALITLIILLGGSR